MIFPEIDNEKFIYNKNKNYKIKIVKNGIKIIFSRHCHITYKSTSPCHTFSLAINMEKLNTKFYGQISSAANTVISVM